MTSNLVHQYLPVLWPVCIITSWHHVRVMVFWIARNSTVCSKTCSRQQHRKHENSVLLVLLRGIHRWPVDSPEMLNVFPCHDILMWWIRCCCHRYAHCCWYKLWNFFFFSVNELKYLKNWLRPSDKSRCKLTRSSLVHARICHLKDTESLPEPIMTYC